MSLFLVDFLCTLVVYLLVVVISLLVYLLTFSHYSPLLCLFLRFLDVKQTMGFFDHLQTKGIGAIQAQRPQIRQVQANTTKSSISKSPSVPAQLSYKDQKNGAQATVKRAASSASTSAKSKTRTRGEGNARRLKSESSARKRGTPVQWLSSDDDESDVDNESLDLRISKRAKRSASAETDLKRHIRSSEAFSEDGNGSFRVIHAADVSSVETKSEAFTPAFKVEGEPATVSLQYPGVSRKERYCRLCPNDF